MNKKWLELAGKLLEEASNVASNNTCNDWDFPKDWTKKEIQEIVKEMHEENGDPEEYNPEDPWVTDWWIMSFLAGKIKKEYGSKGKKKKK